MNGVGQLNRPTTDDEQPWLLTAPEVAALLSISRARFTNLSRQAGSRSRSGLAAAASGGRGKTCAIG